MRTKELHFFDSRFERGVDWYRGQFDGAEGAKVAAEATPTYMYDDEAVARMASLVPDARLVAILRNPVDRAYSHYWMNRSLGRESLEFPEAVAAEEERLHSGGQLADRRFSYVERGRYGKYLSRLSKAFPRDRILLLITEDMHADPAAEWKTLFGFLEIAADFEPPGPDSRVNAHAEYRSLRLRFIARRFPAPVQRAIGSFNRREVPYPKMDAETRAQLEASFAKENAALATWLGRELPW